MGKREGKKLGNSLGKHPGKEFPAGIRRESPQKSWESLRAGEFPVPPLTGSRGALTVGGEVKHHDCGVLSPVSPVLSRFITVNPGLSWFIPVYPVLSRFIPGFPDDPGPVPGLGRLLLRAGPAGKGRAGTAQARGDVTAQRGTWRVRRTSEA